MRVCLTESDLLPKHFVFGCGRLVRDLLHIPIERKQVTARNLSKKNLPGRFDADAAAAAAAAVTDDDADDGVNGFNVVYRHRCRKPP